jgi:hypothetical protein
MNGQKAFWAYCPKMIVEAMCDWLADRPPRPRTTSNDCGVEIVRVILNAALCQVAWPR